MEIKIITFLAIIIDLKKLRFSEHAAMIKSEISRTTIRLLVKLENFLPIPMFFRQFTSHFLIHPYLTHGIEAWHSAPQYLINKLFMIKDKAIRAISNINYNDHTNIHF